MTELEESNRQFVEAWRLFARGARNGVIETRDGIEIAFAGHALPLVNMIFFASPVEDARDLGRRLDAAAAFAAGRGVPWMFTICEDWLPRADAERVPAMIAAAGLAPMSAATGMVSEDLAPPRRPPPPALEMRSADGMASYRCWSSIHKPESKVPWASQLLPPAVGEVRKALREANPAALSPRRAPAQRRTARVKTRAALGLGGPQRPGRVSRI